MYMRAGIAVQIIELEDGRAKYMGDGLFVVVQHDPSAERRPRQNVVLSREDLRALQSFQSLTIPLDDGEAHNMGGDLYVIVQADRASEGHPVQNVVISTSDVEAMFALAA